MSDENTQREETGVEEKIKNEHEAEETDPGEEVVLELAGVVFRGKHFGALSRG